MEDKPIVCSKHLMPLPCVQCERIDYGKMAKDAMDSAGYPQTYGLPDELAALSHERSEFYGDPEQSHRAIGLAWEGLLRNRYQHDEHGVGLIPEPGTMFPPDLVALMLAAFKTVRAARPKFRADSYDDAAVYLGYSRTFREEDKG